MSLVTGFIYIVHSLTSVAHTLQISHIYHAVWNIFQINILEVRASFHQGFKACSLCHGKVDLWVLSQMPCLPPLDFFLFQLASMISYSLKAQGQDPYASNWLERLRKIKRLRTKVLQETAAATSDSNSMDNELLTSPRSARRVHMDDFTEYT